MAIRSSTCAGSAGESSRASLGGYAGGFHHGRYDCHGYYVSPQLAEKYSHRIPGGAGCYGAP